jgi:predicted dehydrogenase
MSRNDILIVGIAESDRDLAQRYSKRYGFDMNIVYSAVEEMVEKTQPEGVLAFNSIYDHLRTVEACAPRGIHVMVEKPLAVSVAHAERIAALARKHGTLALTNYETTWYPSNRKAYEMAVAERKLVFCNGHQGTKEIGCNAEFLAWLTDPKLNGGGAVVDFGCYGVNLTTWLMQNRRPVSVLAVLQHIKPDVYPRVDDEATIVLTYPHAQAIIQASWNWPVSRKDMEVYGATGYVKALNAQDFVYCLSGGQQKTDRLPGLAPPKTIPFVILRQRYAEQSKLTQPIFHRSKTT